MEEKKMYTLDDVMASTREAQKQRYVFTGCVYKTLLDELGKERADDLLYKAYFRYGHLKHEDVEVVKGDLAQYCDTYARGEFSYNPYSMDMPYEINGDEAVLRWCTNGECGGLLWFAEGGLTEEQVRDICWCCAVGGDIGYADKCGLDAHFTHTCATGGPCCEIVLKRRKEEE